MKKLTISKKHKGAYYADVQFCLMDEGHSETRNIDKTKTPSSYSWTVADVLPDGGILIREMSETEYKAYRISLEEELQNK